jgi:hypothetical protein
LSPPSPRKRRPEPREAIACLVVVTARKPGKRPYADIGNRADVETDNPEAEARVAAFFARMIRPPGE